MPISKNPRAPSTIKDLCLIACSLVIVYLLVHRHRHHSSYVDFIVNVAPPTSICHILFSISSSSRTFQNRTPYLHLWYKPNSTRALVFLDRTMPNPSSPSLPPLLVSADTSAFPYAFPKGHRSAVRIARLVKEAVSLNLSDVRWFVFGDDDTFFITHNLVKMLSKYDENEWYYIGSNSECYEANNYFSFDMAFGGGGFALSQSLARALARVLDSCLTRYPHLYGSDARIFSCLTELGVSLTHESGFHQVDVLGNLFGLLTSHPMSPLISLHHLDHAEPIFPKMSRTQAVQHLFKAVKVDPTRILQQTVCYDSSNSMTVSVAWGYAVQVFRGNRLLPHLIKSLNTFRPWKAGNVSLSESYMFNVRRQPKNPCIRPLVFFLDSVVASDTDRVWSYYTKHSVGNCSIPHAIRYLEHITVSSRRDVAQMKAPRRQCCDISPSFNETMAINIRHCGIDELIASHA